MKNILTEALVNSATNASFIFSYTNSAKLRVFMGDFNFFIGGIYDIIELYSITIFGGYYVTQKCEVYSS